MGVLKADSGSHELIYWLLPHRASYWQVQLELCPTCIFILRSKCIRKLQLAMSLPRLSASHYAASSDVNICGGSQSSRQPENTDNVQFSGLLTPARPEFEICCVRRMVRERLQEGTTARTFLCLTPLLRDYAGSSREGETCLSEAARLKDYVQASGTDVRAV